MNQRINSPWQQNSPVDVGQEASSSQLTTLETVRQQAGYSLGNDLHAFYSAPTSVHNGDLYTRYRVCSSVSSTQTKQTHATATLQRV